MTYLFPSPESFRIWKNKSPCGILVYHFQLAWRTLISGCVWKEFDSSEWSWPSILVNVFEELDALIMNIGTPHRWTCLKFLLARVCSWSLSISVLLIWINHWQLDSWAFIDQMRIILLTFRISSEFLAIQAFISLFDQWSLCSWVLTLRCWLDFIILIAGASEGFSGWQRSIEGHHPAEISSHNLVINCS